MKQKDDISKFVTIFSKSLPNKLILFLIVICASILIGIISLALIYNNSISQNILYILISGSLVGIIAIAIPSLLTSLIIKLIKRKMYFKHIFFISLISILIYSVFFILASLVYLFTNSYIATIVIILGNVLIFTEWFFITKIVFGLKKKSVIVSIILPTLNILFYIPSSNFLFKLLMPFRTLMFKFYAGIFVFLIISYIILYLFDKPMKKTLGFNTIETFSQIFQNWLFDINIPSLFDGKFGEYKQIEINTLLIKNSKNVLKSILFIPEIHYGPFRNISGSNFPYLLEKYANTKYNTTTFIMHSAVNEDCNPVYSSQLNKVKECLDTAVKNSICGKNAKMAFYRSIFNNAKIDVIDFNNVSLISFTRAPKVTEDISSQAQILFKQILSTKFKNAVLIDAHNSRYENAPNDELKGINLNTSYYNDYVNAINGLKQKHVSSIKMGVGKINIYDALNKPKDLGPGNLNIAIFLFNKFKYGFIQFNANNMSPHLRNQILNYIFKNYGIHAEVYTTDTHFVNSLNSSAKNVLGQFTNFKSLVPFIDKAINIALQDIEPVKIYYNKEKISRFLVWGPNIREKLLAVINSTLTTAKILIPLILIFGTIISIWIISFM